MISFSGEFSQKTKRFMLNNESKANAVASLVVFVITLIALVVVGCYWDWVVLWFIIAPILMLVFSYTSYRNPTQDVLDLIIPTSIVIDGEEIVSEGKKFYLKRCLSQVKKVIDYGEWYYLVFYYEHRCMRFVCQKDLIKEGTIEQFEKLFEDKLVRITK